MKALHESHSDDDDDDDDDDESRCRFQLLEFLLVDAYCMLLLLLPFRVSALRVRGDEYIYMYRFRVVVSAGMGRSTSICVHVCTRVPESIALHTAESNSSGE